MNRHVLLPLAIAAAGFVPACSAAPPPPPEPPVVTPAPPPPNPAPPKPTAEEERAAVQAARGASAVARVPKIAEEVARIRGLTLKHPIPAEIQSQEAFRAFLDREVQKEMPAAKSAQVVRALVRMGFLKEAIDLGKTVEDAMLSQAGAYYDPDTKRFYIVLVPEDETMLDVMSAHELTHAIDDEYFDLGKYTEDPDLSNDVQQARRLVGEGDATLVMLAYQAKMSAHQDIFDPKNRIVEQAMVAAFSTLDSEMLAKSAADSPQLMEQMGPSVKASLDAMSSIPPFILDPLFGAYTKGCAAVGAVRDAGGWEAVGKLYTDPPESTEQLLHPMEKLVGHRDHPVVLTLPVLPKSLAGMSQIDSDVVGELTMAVYFKVWGDKAPPDEVTGWGGDRYAAFDLAGKVVGTWLTTWDTVADATRFAKAYEASFATRFHGEKTETQAGASARVVHPDGTVTTFVRTGKDVAILDGAPANKVNAMLAWLKASKREQKK